MVGEWALSRDHPVGADGPNQFLLDKEESPLELTAVIITIGPCNFSSTLMGFLSASALGKVMGQAAGY